MPVPSLQNSPSPIHKMIFQQNYPKNRVEERNQESQSSHSVGILGKLVQVRLVREDHAMVEIYHLGTVVPNTGPDQQNCLSRVVDGQVVGVNFGSTQFDHCENQRASSSCQLPQHPD